MTATTQAIDAQFKANELASEELAGMLAEKTSAQYKTRWTMLGAMLGLIVVVGLIRYFIAKSVSMPLLEAVDIAERVTDIVGDIVMASQEQTSGIDQINLAITQMDETTQQNSALV